MSNYKTIEINAFIPAKDYEKSKDFYSEIGFIKEWASDDMAYFKCGSCGFHLQNYYVQELAENYMMHLLVESADDWARRIIDRGIPEKYGVKLGKPEDRDWGIRDFTLIDPSGVLWRIGNRINKTV